MYGSLVFTGLMMFNTLFWKRKGETLLCKCIDSSYCRTVRIRGEPRGVSSSYLFVSFTFWREFNKDTVCEWPDGWSGALKHASCFFVSCFLCCDICTECWKVQFWIWTGCSILRLCCRATIPYYCLWISIKNGHFVAPLPLCGRVAVRRASAVTLTSRKFSERNEMWK